MDECRSTGSPTSLYWIPSIARVNTWMNVGILDPLYSQGQYMYECRSTGSPTSLYWIPSIASVNTWMNVGLLDPLCRSTGFPL
jgi:hypothetical protein